MLRITPQRGLQPLASLGFPPALLVDLGEHQPQVRIVGCNRQSLFGVGFGLGIFPHQQPDQPEVGVPQRLARRQLGDSCELSRGPIQLVLLQVREAEGLEADELGGHDGPLSRSPFTAGQRPDEHRAHAEQETCECSGSHPGHLQLSLGLWVYRTQASSNGVVPAHPA